MKKIFLYGAAGLLLASCASDEIVDNTGGGYGTISDAPISFTTNQKNITRSYTDLNKAEHYNFGVFAFKSTDKVNEVMSNYLVGYYDEAKAYQEAGTTVGDQPGQEDGKSYWMYEGMGYAQYAGTYAGAELTDAYKSNKENQYLKYWDNSAAYTAFYAYAPYINNAVKPTATYVDGTAQSATGADTYVLTIPNGTLTDGYDDASLSEYMYAYNKVEKANYGHDVPLQFNRLNAKVNIKFWENIDGYKVRILDLTDSNEGVQAAASIKDGESGKYGYKAGMYYLKNGVKIQFAPETNDAPVVKQFEGELGDNTTTLKFKSPTDAAIGENRYSASASETTYYAIPKGDGENVLANDNTDFSVDAAPEADLAKTGFTFHVSYELTAEDTGERIVVRNATVHVPYDYCNWKANTHYTYIFKITSNSNGSTDETTDVDPTDPEVPTEPSLYPIIFDNCTVVDWEENVSEWEITEGTTIAYHDIQLSTYSIEKSGEITVEVTDNDTWADHGIDYTKIAVTDPNGNAVDWYNSGTKKIIVPETAAAGVYTVTYTCTIPTGVHANHPETWTEHFFVGNAYEVTLHRYVIGTNYENDGPAKLNITATKDAADVTDAASTAGQLVIDYPDNFTDSQKAEVKVDGTDVVVTKNATPGVYKIVYTIDEGKQVKVAEKTFEVVDYSLTLSHTVVFNKVGGTVVKGNQAADADHVYTCSLTGASIDGNKITVVNNTAEGEYTVTYTVFGSDDDKTVYTKKFEVRNTHSVSVNKGAIDRNVGTSEAGDTSTDKIIITTLFNGEAPAATVADKLSIVQTKDGAAVAGFTITRVDETNTYTLQVNNDVATGNYFVKFVQTVAGADKAEYVSFVVTE